MATLDVVTLENKKAGSVDLNATVFEAPVRTDLLHAEVRRQLTRRRSGTHSTKNRTAVSGGRPCDNRPAMAAARVQPEPW